jgi:hypothetical protein
VVNSTGAANTIGALTGAASNTTSTTINATSNLTTGAPTNLGATLTITGAGLVDLDASALQTGVTTVNASNNSGGVRLALSSLATVAVTGSSGNDLITSGASLTTGSVNAGDGTDTLILGTNTAHADTTTEAGKYTNFETIRVGAGFSMANFPSATGVELSAMTNQSITNLTATQAANVKVLGDQTTGVTLALASASGSSDVLTMTMGTGTTTGAAFDIAALTVTGFETVNLNANNGPTATAGANQTVTVASLTGATLSSLNLTGSAFSITAADTTAAVAINGSALTGDDATTELGLTIGATTFANGSTVTGSAYDDSVTLDAGTEGVTFNGGAGKDGLTADAASIAADGTTDTNFNGGDGEDTLTVNDAAVTLTDVHFTNMSNLEKLTLSSGTGATSITSGSAFNSAFPSGVTITQAGKADGSALTYSMGLATVPVTVALTTAEYGDTSIATAITTGSAADTITVTASSFASYAGAGATITITSNAGNDTITYTTGDLDNVSATSQAVTITAGAGQDTITKTGTNGNDNETTSLFVFAAGDSTTTAYDTITGYDITASGDMADMLDFAGTAAIGTLGTSTDFGTILSHSISNGFASFDDASSYASALNITSSNLSDVVGYLAANTSTNDVVAFAYDSDNNGSADATMVYHNGSTDSLVLLAAITAADAIITTNISNGDNDIYVQ